MSLPPRIAQWWLYLQEAARAHDVDPYTLAAICDRETLGGSSSGLDRMGPGGRGDGGHGHGLMQVDDRSHPELIAQVLPTGVPAWADPAANTAMGAGILAEAFRAFCGDELPAIAAYNAGIGHVRHVLTEVINPHNETTKLRALDAITTGGDYVSDVLRRRAEFLKPEEHP